MIERLLYWPSFLQQNAQLSGNNGFCCSLCTPLRICSGLFSGGEALPFSGAMLRLRPLLGLHGKPPGFRGTGLDGYCKINSLMNDNYIIIIDIRNIIIIQYKYNVICSSQRMQYSYSQYMSDHVSVSAALRITLQNS